MKVLSTERILTARRDGDNLVEVDCKWLSHFIRRCEHRGQEFNYHVISRARELVPSEEKQPDAVVIVGITTNNEVILTLEFRPAIDARELSFPAGLIDGGETAEEAATREFKEETGLDFEPRWKSPRRMYSSAGSTDESVQYVFGEVTGESSHPVVILEDTPELDTAEDIKTFITPQSDLEDMIRADLPFSARTWPILVLLNNYPDGELRRILDHEKSTD